MDPGRREFLKKALGGLLVLFGLGFLIPGLAVFSPVDHRKKTIAYFPLFPEEELPRAGVKKGELTYTLSGKERKARVFLVSAPGELIVLSATCSHLGCLVNYNKARGEFICPCHQGRYDRTGKNIAGPPPAPLSRMPVKIEQGVVLVGMTVEAGAEAGSP